MESFSLNLKQIEFKTFYRNQMATFGYDDLFAGRRVIVFSINNSFATNSGEQLEQFEIAYSNLKSLGVDDIYAVDSDDWLIGPMVDKRRTDIRGLPDRNMDFVKLVSEYYNINKDVSILAKKWQYMVIITDGRPEKLWHTPFKEGTALSIMKDATVRYRGLTIDKIEKYLVDNPR